MTAQPDAPRRFPLAKLDIAEENARFGRPIANDDVLAANIKAHGLLSPLLGYELKGRVKVFAGARRLAALKIIGAADAPVSIRDRKEARALSLAENDQREDMHPAEAAKAWAAMIDQGADITAIANAFGKSEHFVQQRVKLAGLFAPIFEAFAANEIGLAIAEVYAGAPPERQSALWKRFGKKGNRWSLKQELEKGRLGCDDRLAKFVGEAAYVAAGGRVEKDLFANTKTPDEFGDFDEDETESWWLDRAIAEKCAAAKIDAEVQKLKSEGWSFVEHGERLPHGQFKQIAPCKTAEAKKKAGAFIELTHDGGMKISRNLTKATSKTARHGGPIKASKVKPIGAAAAKPEPQPPITNAAHEYATRVASRIVGRSIANDVAGSAAEIVMTAFLVRTVFDDDERAEELADARILDLARARSWDGGANGQQLTLISDGATARDREAWAKKLPPHWDHRLEQALAGWSMADRGALFAFCVGDLIRHAETRPEREDLGREVLGVAGALAGAEPGEHWTPSTWWLMSLSREELDKAARAVGVTPGPKKGATAEAVARAAEDKAWTPPLLLDLVGAPVKTAAKPAPTKKARAK